MRGELELEPARLEHMKVGRTQSSWPALVRSLCPFCCYLLLQTLVVIGAPAARFPDSRSYEQLELTGRALRLPTVPLVYTLLPDDSLRIAAQVLLAAGCWWFLASVAARLIHDRRIAIGLRLLVLVLGLVGPVATWNSTILSESIALSLTALMIGGWLRFAQAPSRWAAVLALVATVLWTFTRQQHVPLTLLIALTGLAWFVLVSKRDRLSVAIAVALVATGTLAVAAASRNQTISNRNVASVVQLRVLPDRDRRTWFIDHGMPYSPALARLSGRPYRDRSEEPRSFNDWVDQGAARSYLRFVLTHPAYTLRGPLPYFVGKRPSEDYARAFGISQRRVMSLLSPDADYGVHRAVVPWPIQWVVFRPGYAFDLLGLAVFALAATLLTCLRWGFDRRLWVPLLVVASAIPQGYLVWLGGGEAVAELDRLSVVLAVSVRIGVWIILAVAVDRLVNRRSRTSAA